MSVTGKPAAAVGTIKLGELTVNRLGFGAMRVAGEYVWCRPRKSAPMLELLRRAFDLGHTFFDTADSYGPNVSEDFIAEALHPYPKELVFGTKGGLVRPSRHRWDECGRPEHLRRALDGSLKRLRLERIELYQARRIAPIVSVQNEYNVGDRSSDAVLAACERAGIAFIPWSPLGGNRRGPLRLVRVQGIAARLAATPAQIALAWLLARSPVMLPIPGTRSVEHLEENANAARVALSPDDFAALEGR